MGKRLMRIVLLAIKEYRDPYYRGVAAQMAFYFMLSIVPIFIVLTQLLGILDIPLRALESWIDKYVAESMADTIKSFLEYRSATATNIVFIIMAVWSASRIEFCLMRLTNYTYSEGQDLGKFWRDRLRAMLTMVITICSIALAVDGEALGSATATVTPAAVENFFNVSAFAYVNVPRGCCTTIAVKNINTQTIELSNANLIVERVA